MVRMIQELLPKIAELKKQIDARGALSDALQKNLDAWYKVELTYTSNALEGNTLTRQETALLIEKGITPEGKTITESLEAENHAKAVDFVRIFTAKNKRASDITLPVLLDIHRLILQKIDDANAGRLRTVPVRVAGSTTIFPNSAKVPSLMDEMLAWLHTAPLDATRIAVEAHYRLVTIHPFVDGNGRVARLLLNVLLMQSGYPPIIVDNTLRKEYLTALEMAQTEGNKETYEAFMYRRIIDSLGQYLKSVE